MSANVPDGVLRFGHSPDPDDAFMFYGFATGAVAVELSGEDATSAATGTAPTGVRRWRVEHVLEDIQSLNERALRGDLEITAISAHAYPYVADRYWVMKTGVSMGDGYGPIVVARTPQTLKELRGRRIAIPGAMTTAALALRIYLDDFQPVVLRFDQILEAVRDGAVDAGVLIHEGQLTYGQTGLHKVADLGALWSAETGLPLPLGLDVVRKDLGPPLAAACSLALRRSIAHARAHESEAMEYALRFGRGLDRDLGGRFVNMYVNDWTTDMGEAGKRALTALLDRAAERALTPRVGELVLV